MINVKRSQPAPKCLSKEKLKKSGDYKCGDVIERLQEDFHNKCYLCEEKEPSTINVEHLKPHRGNIELKFDWNNLFWSCGHCNNTKSDRYEQLIDCTVDSICVSDVLKFDLDPFPGITVIVTPLSDNAEVIETAQLLNEIYNGTTKLKITEGLNIKRKIQKELIGFNELLTEYFNPNKINKAQGESLKKDISAMLNVESPFTAFKIWIIKNNSKLYEEFGELIPDIKKQDNANR